ncbi:hypothetical protein EPA93_13045 [Ktedonosporobacter rubrisoli]|uniref:Uncharacterized protein n=1 Tax=Ktedonosporobacter rubrisoli TaxID=2509675 RepID=A0A4V0YYN9_KTERU|nr:hypothetical protein [Ktedonosporobacter rubrisoli]QBD76881.1 hypothetical protein EPA93_13045 [Ktedonosporobacter rubrisoli]
MNGGSIPHQTRNKRFVRNTYLGSLLEAFFVSGITTVILIRIYLAATGYPQIGGRGLHFAHLLWGGLLMLISLVLFMAFQGRTIQYSASIVGGAGFGAFIDELGKFITSDNNYFFQPAIALIYVIFILLLLGFRALERHTHFSEQERLAAVLDLLKEGVLYDLSPKEKAEALYLLHASQTQKTMNAQLLLNLVEHMQVEEPSRPGLFLLIGRWLHKLYRQIIQSSSFIKVTFICVLCYAFLSTLATISVLIFDFSSFSLLIFKHPPQFDQYCLLISSLLSDVLVLFGALQLLRRRPIEAYRWFQRGVLVSILLTQIFLFYQNQLQALWDLLINLILLSVIHFMQHAERREQRHKALEDMNVQIPQTTFR